MPFGLSRLFSRKPAPSIFTTTTTNTHWNEETKTYQHRADVPMPATFEELTTNPELIALTIFHSMPYSTDLQRTAAWMAEELPERQQVLAEYLKLFNWDGESIVTAFRALCSRIQLKGESQHLDRIVDAFATRWLASNPNHKFVSHGVVYTVAYSILLLNTDLHTNVEGNKAKMTQKQYVRYVLESLNKMFATEKPVFAKVSDYGAYLESENPSIDSLVNDKRDYARVEWFNCLGGVLKLYYKSIAREPLMLPDGVPSLRSQVAMAEGDAQSLSSGSGALAGGAVGAAAGGTSSRSVSGASSKYSPRKSISRRGSMVDVNSDSDMAASARKSSLTSQTEHEELDGFTDQEGLDKLRLLGPPWAKEGPLKFQHFHSLSSGQKKQHKQEWVDLFAVAERGQLRLYRLRAANTGGKGRAATSTRNTPEAVGDGNWLNRAQLVHNFILTHALAQQSDQAENQGEWSLMLSDGRLLRFKTGTPEIADEYVYTCNYWAARLSKPPQVEMISSTEYGWGRPMELAKAATPLPPTSAGSNSETIVIGDEKIYVYAWKKQPDTELHSSLSAKEQFEYLSAYVTNVDEELGLHSAVLGDMLRVFNPKYPVSARAHSNWEARSQYLLRQTAQYTTYCNALDRSLKEEASRADEAAVAVATSPPLSPNIGAGVDRLGSGEQQAAAAAGAAAAFSPTTTRAATPAADTEADALKPPSTPPKDEPRTEIPTMDPLAAQAPATPSSAKSGGTLRRSAAPSVTPRSPTRSVKGLGGLLSSPARSSAV